jgi:mannosyl-oligosaccharide alpha-1,2-mannosidase
MKLPVIVNQIVDYVPDIDWSVSANNEPVSLFETTIRYVAGLLSGYDLLNGPLSNLVDDVSRFPSHEDEETVKLTTSPSYRKPKSTPSSNKPPISPTT